MAKLAEQAERYDEMVEEMKKVAQMVHDQELSVEERNLLSVGVQERHWRTSCLWRIISSIEQKEESKGQRGARQAHQEVSRSGMHRLWALWLPMSAARMLLCFNGSTLALIAGAIGSLWSRVRCRRWLW